MDPSLVLEETVQDVSNLDAEFRYMLEEMRGTDAELQERRKKCQQKEAQMHKFIRQNGSITEFPKEDTVERELHDSLAAFKELQRDKILLANTSLFLVSRHLEKLDKSIAILEEDGVLAPLEDELESVPDSGREDSVSSVTMERNKRLSAAVPTDGSSLKKKKYMRSVSIDKDSDFSKQATRKTISPVRISDNDIDTDTQKYDDELFSNNAENDEEDKTLYCFCQSVSYGEMVACDGPNCKYEWFHYSCVNLKEPPKGTWYCPDCKEEMLREKTPKKKKA
ncbi:histone acetyltransferase YNG2 KNAG_0B04390 [Huiozyma naganishii CBS 8797]|uniref:Chromatin modification-related protein n=1 Tax=Huiozyma naganishii (strain ATCC MYA-139 / BCRC 22969 / CBS 8797 / KCTC 17520 / NBRC 10181 / NCYC 3082 / Yp74L-3) TaxID=1071383 RepID=J7RH57_HUIN7|nr:hypothetical protein KNAG_0B04390 [Kazachstania naganishii CBS 8797]CCK68873.1 hypothetical protein KNAG_0B04390 [Kazachstania naganishii CBS 8797]